MNDLYRSMLDVSYDAQLAALNLRWLPWIGSNYRQAGCKAIVLGESVYDYSNGDAEKSKRILSIDSVRRRHFHHAMHDKFRSAFVKNFERAMYMKRNPSQSERRALWSQVIYHNLVTKILPARDKRPTKEDYVCGWKTLLQMAEVLDARHCIVYGLEKPKVAALIELLKLEYPHGMVTRHRLAPVGQHYPVSVTVSVAERTLELFFIRHPSAFFSWRKWGVVLSKHRLLLGSDLRLA